MIDVEGLCKRYGDLAAVDQLTFHVGRGEVVGFLGPNGAGKTTTLRIIAGYLGATSGRVRVAGFDIFEEPLEARRRLGYMTETCPLYGEMRVREYLTFRSELKRVPRRQRLAEARRVAGLAGIDDHFDVLIGHLSKGLRQRVGLADALVGAPPLLILDEPTSGLDPNQIREVRALVRTLCEEHTIVLSTHILSEVESLCDRAIVIDAGRAVAQGTIAELRAEQQPRAAVIAVHLPGEPDGLEALGRDVAGVAEVTVSPIQEGAAAAHVRIAFAQSAEPNSVVEDVVRALVQAGHGVREVRLEGAGLEDVFARLTHQVDEGADAA